MTRNGKRRKADTAVIQSRRPALDAVPPADNARRQTRPRSHSAKGGTGNEANRPFGRLLKTVLTASGAENFPGSGLVAPHVRAEMETHCVSPPAAQPLRQDHLRRSHHKASARHGRAGRWPRAFCTRPLPGSCLAWPRQWLKPRRTGGKWSRFTGRKAARAILFQAPVQAPIPVEGRTEIGKLIVPVFGMAVLQARNDLSPPTRPCTETA